MIEILKEIAEIGNPGLYDRGCYYFHETFIPSIRLMSVELAIRERSHSMNIDNFVLPGINSGLGVPFLAEDKELMAEQKILAKCWELAGDIYTINHAMLRAVRAYETATGGMDKDDDVVLKLMKTFEKIGEKQKAFDCVNMAIKFSLGGNEVLEIEKQRLQDNMNYDIQPIYTDDHKTWKKYEAIACEYPQFVIEKVANTNTKDIDLLKCLANAYGALKENKLCVETWQKIINLDEDFEIELPDEFYTPKECWDQIIFMGEGLA